MASNKDEHRVLYVGNDHGYFKTICDRFRSKYVGNIFVFTQLYEKDKKKAQLEFLKVLSINPHWIYIDFSDNIDCHIEILTFLKREISTKKIPVVGLLPTKDIIQKYQNLGADFTMIKDGEFHDVVFHPFYKSFPGGPKIGNFAKAKVKEEFFLINDIRIGYITNTLIHAEGNFELKEGDKLEVNIGLPLKNVPSKNFIIKKVSTEDLYYDYQYSYDLEITFVDPPNYEILEMDLVPKDLEGDALVKAKKEFEKKKKEINNEYVSQLENCKKLHSKWLEENTPASRPKSTKVLVLDRFFSLIKENAVPINEHHYSIRLQSDLSAEVHEITRLKPQIIAIEYMAQPLKERLANIKVEPLTFNDNKKPAVPKKITSAAKTEEVADVDPMTEARDFTLDILKRVTTAVSSIKGYTPFIIFFNCKEHNSQMLQGMFSYSNIINFPESISIEMITKLSEVIERKLEAEKKREALVKVELLKKENPTKYRKVTEKDFMESRFYIHKFHALSNAEIKIQAHLNAITESDIYFDVNQKLEMRTYKSIFPLPMSFCLVPMEDKSDFQTDGALTVYRALIHSIGENDKKTLRSYVNSIFFDELNQKRKAEQEQFNATNQAFIVNNKGSGDENEEEEEEEGAEEESAE